MSSQTLFRAVLVASALALTTPAPEAKAQSTYATEMNYGREAFDGSNFPLAQRHFKGAFEAASTDGQKATALYSMAVALQRQGRFEEAKEPAAKAVELSPKHSQAKALIDELNNATSKPQPKSAGKGAAPAAAAAQAIDPLAKIEEEERAAIKKAREKGIDLAGEPLSRKPGAAAKDTAKERDAAAQREAAAREREARKDATAAREAREPRETASRAKESRDSVASAAPKSEPAPKAREAKDTIAAATPKPEPTAFKAKEPKEAPPAKEAAARTEPAPAPVVAAIIKKKPQAPAPFAAPAAAPAAAATTAAAATSPIDFSSLGKLEPSGARLIISGPPIQAPLLGAGFTSNDRAISIVTGPAKAADGTENAIEFRQIDIQSGKAGDIYALHADTAAALASVPATAASLITAVPAGKKGRAVSMHTWDPLTVANVDAVELEGSGKDLPIALDALVASRNGQRVAAVHSSGVQIFNIKGLRGASSFRFQARADVSTPVAAAISGNGQRVAISNGARLRFIDRSNVREIGPGAGNQPIDVVALSEAGDLIAASSANSVRLIDAVTGRDLDGLPNVAYPITALAFSPTSDRLALAFYDRVQIWTVADRKLTVDLVTSGNAARVAFSGDGRLLLASGASGARVWLVDPIAAPAVASAGPASSATQTPVAAAPAADTMAAPAQVASVPVVAGAPSPTPGSAAATPTAEAPQPVSTTVAATPSPSAGKAPAAAALQARASGFTEQQPKTSDAAPAVPAAPAPAETQIAAVAPTTSPASTAEASPPTAATSAPVVPAPALAAAAAAPAAESKPAAAPEAPRAEAAQPAVAQAAPAQVAAADPAPAKPDPRKLAQLKSQRGRALNRLDCDRVSALDAEIGSDPRHGECVAKVAQAERARQLARLATDRIAALNAGDCERVKTLDAEIGSGDVYASCVAKAEQTRRTAELNQLTVDRQAAFARFDCAAVKELDTKIGSGALFETCNVEQLVKNGSARDLYLAAAKSDADRKLAEARKYYRAVVDRHPQDDLAIKAAERMTAIADIEKQENNAQMATGSTREPRRRLKRRQ